jgi:hypothetical protein
MGCSAAEQMIKVHFGGKAVRNRRIPAWPFEKYETMTDSSRRRFVVGGLVVVAGAGVAACGGGGAPGSVTAPTTGATPAGPPLVASEASEWDKLVGTSFQISTGTGRVPAVLAALERIADPTRPATLGRQQPFYAIFQMDLRLAPAGGETYQLSHATKGSFDLFLGMSNEIQGKGVLTALLN